MNILVTGGAGFIGSHLVDKLLSQGHFVRVLDNLSTGTNINGKADMLVGDCSDTRSIGIAVRDMDYVFHLAANPSVALSVQNPLDSNSHNLQSTLCLLDACKREHTKKVVLSSTSAVYGNHEGFNSEYQSVNPKTPYALQKYASERYGFMYDEYHQVPFVALRYFNVFGPRQSPSSPYSGVISKFIDSAINNKPVTIFGDGCQCRDFTYVSDIVDANIWAMESCVTPKVLNVATGRSVTLLEALKCVESICRTEISVTYGPKRDGDIYTSKASIQTLSSLGFKTQTTFESGIEKTIDWALNS